MNTIPEPVAFVIDDDEAVRSSLRWLLESAGLGVKTYSNGNAFLESLHEDRHGCILLDVRMPEVSGLEVHERLKALNYHIPVIFITGHGDVPTAVQAMRHGALDFIEKPFNDQLLLERIHHCIKVDQENRRQLQYRKKIKERIALLTPREQEVMALVVEGMPNKSIAVQLHLSGKTVEAHRAKVMEKMQAKSVAELVRMVMESTR